MFSYCRGIVVLPLRLVLSVRSASARDMRQIPRCKTIHISVAASTKEAQLLRKDQNQTGPHWPGSVPPPQCWIVFLTQEQFWALTLTLSEL